MERRRNDWDFGVIALSGLGKASSHLVSRKECPLRKRGEEHAAEQRV